MTNNELTLCHGKSTRVRYATNTTLLGVWVKSRVDKLTYGGVCVTSASEDGIKGSRYEWNIKEGSTAYITGELISSDDLKQK